MADVTWAVAADFARAGSYGTDLTVYAENPGSGVSIDRGMGKDGVSRTAQLTIDLSNRDGTFTPENSASSLYGKLEPDIPIRIQGTHNAITYTLFTGYIRRYDVSFGVNKIPMCRLTCDGILQYIAGYSPVNVTVASRTTSAALTAIASAIGLTAADYTFATGAQTLPVHYVRNQDALSAMLDVHKSEMGGYLFETGDGKIQFDARNTRLGLAGLDDTWGDGTTIFPYEVGYQIVDDQLITKVMVQANIFAAGQADQIILSFSRNSRTGDSLALTAGQIYEVDVDYAGPVTSIVTPVITTDYTTNDNAAGTGTDRSATLTVAVTDRGAGANIKLTNTHSGTVYLTHFQIRGQAKDFASDRPRFEYGKTITGIKLDQGVGIELPFADDTAATKDYAAALCYTYRQVYPRLTLSFDASTDVKKVAMLGVELGDLIKYKDTGLGASVNADGVASAMVDDWWYVEGIKHQIPPDWGGKNFRTTVTLIPSYIYRDLDKCVYDTFNRANVVGDLGTSVSGDVWVADGNMDISGNAARANSDVLQMPNLPLGTGATDQVVEGTFANITTGDEVGVVFRYADASNQYRAYVDFATQEVILEKNVAGVVTEIISPAMTVGASHEIRVINQSTRIRVWVDRILRIDTTDSGLSTGTNVGLFFRTANATATCDDCYGERL